MTPGRNPLRRYAGLWLLAPALPLAAGGASIFVNLEPALWFAIPESLRRGVTADALLYVAGCVIVAAPIAGVAVASSRRRPRHEPFSRGAALGAMWPLIVAVFLFVGTSALVTGLGLGFAHPEVSSFVATSHATLAAVALALSAFGALCGVAFRDPLDAAACSLSVVLLATGGLLVAGASVADAPRELIALALTASPLMVITSAAHIDLVRMGVPYQISPLAHLQVDYPSWYAACAWYLVFAAVCFGAFTWKFRTWRAAPAS
jgi:hypothetical protein